MITMETFEDKIEKLIKKAEKCTFWFGFWMGVASCAFLISLLNLFL